MPIRAFAPGYFASLNTPAEHLFVRIVTAQAQSGALKQLAGLPSEEKLLTEEYVKPIQVLKTVDLKSKNPNLHVEEALVALACCSSTNPKAMQALEQLPKLRDLEFHSSVILSPVIVNESTFTESVASL